MASLKSSVRSPPTGKRESVRAHPSSPLLGRRMKGGKTPIIRAPWKGPYVLTPDLAILPVDQYDPSAWHILVEASA